MSEEKKKKKKRSKANGEGTIWTEQRNSKPYYRGAYVIGYDDKGKPIRKLFSSSSKQVVIDKMAEYRTQKNAGLISSDDKITLQQWFHIWLFEFRINDLKDTSFERYEGIYRNYIKNSTLGKKKLTDIRTADIQAYYNSLIEQGRTSNVVKTLNKHLRTCLNDAIKQGYITRNYCSLVTIPKTESEECDKEKEITFFTPEEQQIFLSSLEKHRNKALFILALGSGLRLGELMALKWEDIDLDNNMINITRAISQISKVGKDGSRTWSILEHPPKTKSSIRTIPIPTKVKDALKTHRAQQNKEKLKHGELYQDNNLVFCTELGNYIDTRNLTRSYARALVKAGIPHKKFHSMRHTYATRLFESDVPIKTVQALMGHSDIATTMNIYTHVIPEKMTDEVQKLNALFS
ncbi:tyrosine-type recombinase/integrase [Zhenhengia yiwuensis]|uniref:Site-specific integrase n=1 Tax=Zhenhengia yiwuensis TaxID=2763666 RepID=A0A926EIL7_9FIRM|nr:site-specific integrase [Zhenhengia yiwuensis]MBC8580948.1 site-specific integrase [Zhenhengia yiwuensis]MBS5799089.1 site-specific integrase [Clostridiales bacterium]